MADSAQNKLTIGQFLLRFIRFILVIAVAVFLSGTLVKLKKQPEKKAIIKTPPSVNVIVVQPESRVMTVEAFGTVKPRKSVKVAVEVNGRIVYLHESFIEGGAISKGELLVQIDPRSYELERSAAQVRITQAISDIDNFKQDIKNLNSDIKLSRLNLDLSRKELERIKTLTENQYASKDSQDRTEQAFIQARMQLQSLENRLALSDTALQTKTAALKMARVDFEKADLAFKRTKIRAGFSGYVLEKRAEIGEYVNPGQVLGIMYKKGHLDVDVRIPVEKTKWLNGILDNRNLPRVEVSMAASNGIRQPGVWKGQVARLKASMDEETRTLPLTIEIQSDEINNHTSHKLKPGAFVKCDIIGETIENLYVIPRHLLKQGDIIFTVNGNQLKMKQVSVFRKYEDSVFIDAGLTPGDQIVTSPLPGALDDMELTILSGGSTP